MKKRIAIIGHGAGLMAQTLMAKFPEVTVVTSEQFKKPNPFDSPTMLINNYREELPPISEFASEPQKRNSRFTPKKKKRKKRR